MGDYSFVYECVSCSCAGKVQFKADRCIMMSSQEAAEYNLVPCSACGAVRKKDLNLSCSDIVHVSKLPGGNNQFVTFYDYVPEELHPVLEAHYKILKTTKPDDAVSYKILDELEEEYGYKAVRHYLNLWNKYHNVYRLKPGVSSLRPLVQEYNAKVIEYNSKVKSGGKI